MACLNVELRGDTRGWKRESKYHIPGRKVGCDVAGRALQAGLWEKLAGKHAGLLAIRISWGFSGVKVGYAGGLEIRR